MKSMKAKSETVNEVYSQGFTISSFARKMEKGRPYLSDVLYGKRQCSPVYAKQIADLLGKPISELFDLVEM